jgi:hypothetical protein
MAHTGLADRHHGHLLKVGLMLKRKTISGNPINPEIRSIRKSDRSGNPINPETHFFLIFGGDKHHRRRHKHGVGWFSQAFFQIHLFFAEKNNIFFFIIF